MEWKAPAPRPGSHDRPIYIDAPVDAGRTGGRRSGRGSKGARWPMVVAIHAVLVVFAVGVVWMTLGSGPSSASAGAITGGAKGRMAPKLPGARETVGAKRPTTTVSVAAEERGAAGSFLQASPARTEEGPAWEDGRGDEALVEGARAAPVRGTTKMVTASLPVERALAPVTTPLPVTSVKMQQEVAPATIEEPGPADYTASGQLYGLPGAKRVVYLVDASGSLVDGFPFILDELRRCITSLQPEQSYAIVFFRGGEVVEAPPLGMVKADTHALARTVRWLDPRRQPLVPRGTARPDAALRRALAYRPDAVVLISDDLTGRIDPEAERGRLIHLIETLNQAGVPIHTAQLRGRDPLATPERLGTLELVAFVTGGTHRYIREAELSTDDTADIAPTPPAIRF